MIRCVVAANGPAIIALVLAAVHGHAQSSSGRTVVGRVTSAETGAPVATARVSAAGTPLVAIVGADGWFRLTDVPANARELSVRGVGYRPATIAIGSLKGGVDTIAVALTGAILELGAVLVTGTAGDTRRRATGNVVTVLGAPPIVDRSAVSNITELLQAKVTGLTILPGSGVAGSAANYRLRGSGSISATNSPAIYVDGLRINTRSQGNIGEKFGQSSTALDAISPLDIESIEVIKGPSAATLFGADAAAGVIQVFTKKGAIGRTKWQSRFDTGWSDWDDHLRPMNYAVVTAAQIETPNGWPGFEGKLPGDIISLRPMADGRALRTARSSRLALSAGGGADRYNYFFSTNRTREEGVLFNNFSDLNSVRANITMRPSERLALSTQLAVSRSHLRFPLTDNAGPMGLLLSSQLAIPGRKYPAPGGFGYASLTPEVANLYDDQTRADRYILGTSLVFAASASFTSTIRAGLDANVGRVELYFPPDPLGDRGFNPRVSLDNQNVAGLIAERRPSSKDITINYDGLVTRRLTAGIVSNSSFGAQYLARAFRSTELIGTDLGAAGLRSISSAAVVKGTDTTSEQKSVGVYLQQQIAVQERLYLTAGARVDNSSVFGSRYNRALYPKFAASYVVSDYDDRRIRGVSSLRLRMAWGEAGNAPEPLDARRSYSSSKVTTSNGSASALRYTNIGNPGLRPERGSELEGGFDSELFGNRLTIEATGYRKITRDALMAVDVAPSTGFSGKQIVNLGTISNSGFEALLNLLILGRQRATWEATLSFSGNRNRLVSFGYDRDPESFGNQIATSQRHQPGYPLGGFWAQTVRRNADGTVLKVAGIPELDTSIYRGSSVPTREAAIGSDVVLFRKLRIHVLADYKGGHYQFNGTDRRRDQAGVSWAVVNPAADPDDVLVRKFTAQTFLYIQPADFIKLRDVSIGFDVPSAFVRPLATSATVTLAGHNLRTWTRYNGADPELNYGGVRTFNRDDLWTVPQTRRFSATFTVAF